MTELNGVCSKIKAQHFLNENVSEKNRLSATMWPNQNSPATHFRVVTHRLRNTVLGEEHVGLTCGLFGGSQREVGRGRALVCGSTSPVATCQTAAEQQEI